MSRLRLRECITIKRVLIGTELQMCVCGLPLSRQQNQSSGMFQDRRVEQSVTKVSVRIRHLQTQKWQNFSVVHQFQFKLWMAEENELITEMLSGYLFV